LIFLESSHQFQSFGIDVIVKRSFWPNQFLMNILQ
jgi:hypothetical protein